MLTGVSQSSIACYHSLLATRVLPPTYTCIFGYFCISCHSVVRITYLQGEPELERLKRELEELKHAPRGLEGTFRSAAEMERHRHQLADAAIEEQLEVQTAFREQGAKLQSLYDKKQRTEFEIAKR